MIRMVMSQNAKEAKLYYNTSLAVADYYICDQEEKGTFHGRLSERLLLDEFANRHSFESLIDNINPNDNTRLTPRTKEERTPGYDVNFHLPKSLSVLFAFSKDENIINAFKESVRETMKDIEADAMTRVRTDNKHEDRPTCELVWSEHLHYTARPVDGHAPDPHIHIHNYIFNMTWDEVEKRYKAGQFRYINRDMPYYQAMFHKRMADRIQALGYNIYKTDNFFEVEGIPTEVLDFFSKRTKEISKYAKEKNITDAKELDRLGAKTRGKKEKGLTMSQLREVWRSDLNANKLGANMPIQGLIKGGDPQKGHVTPDRCINHASLHCFERASVVPTRRLLAEAYKHAIGTPDATIEAINGTFAANESIIHHDEKTQTVCTTNEVLREEQRMVSIARSGMGKMAPLYANAPEINLEGEQLGAVRYVLTNSNLVSIVRGAAGVGKTYLMKEAEKHINAAGKQLITVAPSSDASRGVLREDGFAAATTVAQLLVDKGLQDKIQNQVLWVDEAGLLGTKDMTAVLELAKQQNARLVLGGDEKQHSSVLRGDGLRILQRIAKVRTAQVTLIRRQRTEQHRKAVQCLADGRTSEAFKILEQAETMREMPKDKPSAQLVADYVSAVKEKRKALVIAPTHEVGDMLTNEIRSALKARNMVGKADIAAQRLINLNYTEAEKQDYRIYRPGQVIQFNQNRKGIKRGSRWKVMQQSKDGVQIQNQHGRVELLGRDRPDTFDVFRKSEIAIAKGDKIRVTKNGFDRNNRLLNNGEILTVKSVARDGTINLQNVQSKCRYTIEEDFAHISHAHCITSHSSQGKTVDDVFIAVPSASFGAVDSKQFYVSVSRSTDRCFIYTDDKEGLEKRIQDTRERQSALEMMQEKNMAEHESAVRELKRDKAKVPNPDKRISREPTRKLDDRDYEPRV